MSKFIFNGVKGNWFTYFDRTSLNFPNGEWKIKAENESLTPIAILPESQGGIKNDNGLSPYNQANARLISSSPQLLRIALDRLKQLKRRKPYPQTLRDIEEIEDLLKYINS